MSRLALYFLGTPRIELDGEPISFSHHKALALLVYLAVTRQSHTRQALTTLLWPDYNPAAARREVRRMLWVLNKRLGPGWLETDQQTVLLPPQPDLWLDVDRFRELLALCKQHGHAASEVCPACQEPLMEVVALAQGDFLAGFTLPDSPDFETWQTFETESLHRELAGALARLVELLSQQGETWIEQAIAYARRWLKLDPLNEAAHRQLMRLYTWSGQVVTALRQYQICVQSVQEELGTSPSVETTALFEVIKANRLPSLPPAPIPATRVPELSKSKVLASQPVHNLPIQPTPFIGRQQEVVAVCRLLTRETPQVRLVTLTGPGGIGKTRLALQVAADLLDYFADGVFFVPLASFNDPQLLLSAIARQLDVHEGGSQPMLQILKSVLQEKQRLLVLDNFEHIVTAAPLIAELLAAAPQLKVLVASRALLNLRGEYELLVPSLKLPDQTQAWSLEGLSQHEAIQLFVERAQTGPGGFTLTDENAPIVAEICHRLDGLPLAIELAAARLKLLSPQALLARLSQRLKVLTGGSQDMPARQQTLRNTIDWSYSLLDQTEQILFSRLAVFVGGFTLETAEAIGNADGLVSMDTGQTLDILEGVTSLLNKSLLVQQAGSSQPRFRMLEIIREYGLERLEERGQLEALQQRHAHYFAAQLDEIGMNFHFFGGLRLDWAEEEHDNLSAMLAWTLAKPAETELGLRMVGVLYWFWYRRGYLSEGRAWCQRFMTSTSEKSRTRSYASFLMGSGSLALMQGDLVEAGQRLESGIDICRELNDERGLAMTLLGWGVLALYQGDTAKAQCIFEESLAIGKRLNLWWISADSLLNMGNTVAAQGDYGTARTWLEQAAAVAKSNNEAWLVANVLNNLGEVARIQGDYERAQRSYEESQILFRTMNAKSDVARSLHNLGYVARHRGDYKRAEMNFREGLRMFQELGNKRGMVECLAGLAGLVVTQGQAEARRAARLLAAAALQMQTSGASWWPADQLEYDRNLVLIRAALDQEAFAASWAEGQTMSLPEAIADASG